MFQMDFGCYDKSTHWVLIIDDTVDNAAGESISALLIIGFGRCLKLQFQGTELSSYDDLLVYCGLDGALGLSQMVKWELRDSRTGENAHHGVLAMF
ncbi:MAG: hypothetical protein GY742_21395 [Hyphomicrobiales bacterium]|nr:hypothetical protein [Hyphomicrobiales bacterium]